jgi:hypothetical protein
MKGISVTCFLSKLGGGFLTDHPLDPANSYLYNSFVESPDMMTLYKGEATACPSSVRPPACVSC